MRSIDEERRRTAERSAWCVALLAGLLACAYLGRIIWTTQWGMDADEAVHATEALRLTDRVTNGEIGGFVHDAWVPERWAPPVNPHVRWYPPVHAICTVPFLAIFGASDFTARVPSIVFLLGTVLLFFELGRRLGRRHAPDGSGATSGLCAALLLLAAPNVLTFSAQSLTEPSSLFFTFLALFAYVISLERDHAWVPATLGGLALGVAMLTKYDHGGLLALALGLSEVARHRGRVDQMLKTGPVVLFGLPLLMIAAWFAGADKIDALRDSVSHPFAGSGRLVFLDFFLTWIVEYGSSLAMGALAVFALALGWKKSDPALRAVWFWAVLTTLFLGIRSRFHFRYNFVEAPAALLVLAILLPGAVAAVARWLAAPSAVLPAFGRKRRLVLAASTAAGVIALALGAWGALSPDGVFDRLRAPFHWLYDLRDDHFGMTLAPDAYVDHFAAEYHAFALHLGGSLAALGLGLLVFGVGGMVVTRDARERMWAGGLVWLAVLAATVPGAARLYATLPAMVEWELECDPEIDGLQTRVTEVVDRLAATRGDQPEAEPLQLLLGGGWDQLTNNGMRWHALTRGTADLRYGDIEVVGDMIGSLVFPPEGRIRYWAEVLATATDTPTDSLHALPDAIVLVFPDPDTFLYRTRMGPEAAIYEDLLERRGGYARVAYEHFERLQADLYVFVRRGPLGPAQDHEEVLGRFGIHPDTEGNASRFLVNEDGWSMRDESLRHFIRR